MDGWMDVVVVRTWGLTLLLMWSTAAQLTTAQQATALH
jgi:hypothetical protein